MLFVVFSLAFFLLPNIIKGIIINLTGKHTHTQTHNVWERKRDKHFTKQNKTIGKQRQQSILCSEHRNYVSAPGLAAF